MSEYIIEYLPDTTSIEREEIVRCKSCKYYDQNDAPSDVYPDRYWCDRMTSYMPTDGFCSFGKRKVVGE